MCFVVILSVCLSVCQALSVCLSVYLALSDAVCLSICLAICHRLHAGMIEPLYIPYLNYNDHQYSEEYSIWHANEGTNCVEMCCVYLVYVVNGK